MDTDHIIHTSRLTDHLTLDDSVVNDLLDQIEAEVEQFILDGAYDKNPTYHEISNLFPISEILIPPDSDAVYGKQNHVQKNRNLEEIKAFGRMSWQKVRDYGKRNYSELCIQRYKRILGNKLHAREFTRQKNEATLGCGILNKMTRLGMPKSYKFS